MRGARRGWLAIAAAVVALGGWVLAREVHQEGRWAEVQRQDLVIGVTLEGELKAVSSSLLGPPQLAGMWNFKLSMMAPEGKVVAEGEPVMGFDTTSLQQRLLEEVAERDSAEKELEKKGRDLEAARRDRELQRAEAEARLRRAKLKIDVPAEVVSRSELAEARIDHRLAETEIAHFDTRARHAEAQGRAELAALRGQRDRAAARVDQIRDQIERMTVKAPRGGTVVYRTERGGEKKKVGDSVWKAEQVLEIPDLSRMLADAEVAEADAGRLAVGQRAVLRLDAYPDREYAGRLRAIRRTVQKKSRRKPVKVVRVEIELDETDEERMRPGMRLRGTVEVERLEEALVIPEEAVSLDADGAAVWVRSGLRRRRVTPVLGRRNDRFFEVVEGLEEGQAVALEPRADDEEAR